MSLSTVHFILKKHLKVQNIFARWVPHLLTDEQNRQRVLVAKKLLKKFQTYDNIVLESLKHIGNDALSLVLNISVFYMTMALLMPLK